MKKINLFWGYHFIVYVRFSLAGLLPKIDIWDTNVTQKLDLSKIKDISRFSRVLNFFPVPVEEECNANDGRRKGICMNTYECRMDGGRSYGFCAHGFGVCCVFTATCGEEISKNLTYFVNPDFPDLSREMSNCSLKIKKMDEEISQIRLDFIHFNLGQPNRQTGVCEEDVFVLSTEKNNKEITICGLNSGQHVYYDVDNINTPLSINMNLSRKAVTRLWEIRVTQIPFSQRAPAGCLQYFEDNVGVIQTLNFADNGRHLANQDYNICIRQEEGMCSITYEPCHENAFRISPNTDDNLMELGSGEGSDTAESRQMQICGDSITVPCESDDLLMMEDADYIQEMCDTIHCGPSLCSVGENPCKIESNVTPFVVGVHFGKSVVEDSPENNLGMCLVYEQLPCNI